MDIRNGFTTVIVSDMDNAVKFYTEALGFKLTRRFNSDYAYMDAPGFTIGLVSSILRGQHPGKCESLSIGIQVDHIEEDMKELQTKGVVFTSDIIIEKQLKLAYFTDPDKNPLYLVSPQMPSG